MNRVGHQLQAMQLDDQAQEEQGAAVLCILLQHDSARRELRVVSRLLCCSKELASAVVEHCTGQLDLDDTAFHQALDVSSRQAISWLRKHARLAQALNLSTDKALLEPVMAAGPQTLRLQSLSADTGTALPLLEQLPASFLTRLELTVTDAPRLGGARYAAQVSAALGRLTALRSLVLFNKCDLYLPGLSLLSNLTRLYYRGELFVPQRVPGQLLELTLLTFRHVLSGPGAPSALDLRHLTALTSLAGADLVEGDVLPPSLLWLEADCR